MTGNTNKWRAPLAGLASLAMVATMGVAASTANASTWVDPTTDAANAVVNGVAYTKGYSYADVIATKPLIDPAYLNDSFLAKDPSTDFSGYKVNDSASTALTGVAADKSSVTVNRDYNAKNGLQVHYTATTDEGTTDLGYVWVSATTNSNDKDDLNATITAGQLPYDKAGDDVALDVSGLAGVHHFADTKLGSTVEVNVPASAAYKLTFEANSDVVYPGAVADGRDDGALSVDVAQDGTFDPQTVIDSAFVVSSSPYAIKRFYFVSTGKTFTKDTVVDGPSYSVTPEVVKGFTVTYVDGSKTLKTEVIYNGGKPAAYTPTRSDGSEWVGWSTTKDGKNIVDPTKVPVKKDVTYYATWANGGSHTVTYKFNDGTTADKTVTVLASQKLARPENPKRDGWLFAGWYVDANNDGILNAGEQPVDDTAKAAPNFGDKLDSDYTFIAKWIQADKATLEAAFNYVDGGDESKNPTVKDEDGNDTAIFTKASFAEYVKTYLAVQADYAKAKDAADAKNEQIPADTYNDLLNRLVAGWQKLEFVHEGNQLSATSVNRLYNAKAGDHFYTQSKSELATLTDTVKYGFGYSNEGRLFQTAPKGVEDEFGEGATKVVKTYAHLESFKYVSSNSDIEQTLLSLTDPILTKVTRLYNRVNGDHVWSVSADEVASLSASADWNNEGAAFYVPRYTGSQSVTRLYNAKLSRHVLSTSAAEQANLARNGWTVEGVAFKAY